MLNLMDGRQRLVRCTGLLNLPGNSGEGSIPSPSAHFRNMKTVIKQKMVSCPVVELSDISTDKYYGVHPKYHRAKGFITKTAYGEGNGVFTLLCVMGLTRANGWNQMDHVNFHTHISALLDKDWPVYEFDTFKELSEWLIKE